MVFKTESAFMQDIGDLKKYYTSISDRTKNSGSNTAAVKWMYMMGVEPTAFAPEANALSTELHVRT